MTSDLSICHTLWMKSDTNNSNRGLPNYNPATPLNYEISLSIQSPQNMQQFQMIHSTVSTDISYYFLYISY